MPETVAETVLGHAPEARPYTDLEWARRARCEAFMSMIDSPLPSIPLPPHPEETTLDLCTMCYLELGPLDETYTLASLEVGTPLQGPVVGHHRNKLWLKVPVVRTGAGGAEVPVDAMLKLPSKHRLLKNPEASLGQQLKVYVQAARTADATLVVSSKPPPSEELRGSAMRHSN